MRLNELRPEEGARTTRRRVGRGVGSGLGKTCGRGHKGQTSRAGGYHKVGFEGGQMPLQRRLPKRGFRSHTSATRAEVRLTELAVVIGDIIDLEVLKATGVVPTRCVKAKIISSGRIGRAVAVHGIDVTAGARVAITQAGGTVES